MTVLCFERLPVDDARAAEFEALVSGCLEGLRKAPGILWADVAEAGDDDPSYILLAEWRTSADADAWEAGDAATAFTQATDVLLRGDPTRRRFSPA